MFKDRVITIRMRAILNASLRVTEPSGRPYPPRMPSVGQPDQDDDRSRLLLEALKQRHRQRFG